MSFQKPSILICVHSDKENCEIGNNPQLSDSSVNHQFYLYSEQGEHISMSARCNMMPTPELPVNKEIKLLLITSNNPLNRTEVVDSVMFDPITLSLSHSHAPQFVSCQQSELDPQPSEPCPVGSLKGKSTLK